MVVEVQGWVFVGYFPGSSGLGLPQPCLVGSQGEDLAQEKGCLGSNLSPATHYQAVLGQSLHVFVPWFSHLYKGLSPIHGAGPAERNLPRPGGACGVLASGHRRKRMKETGVEGVGPPSADDSEVALTGDGREGRTG